MKSIALKEVQQFFSSLTAYLTIILFLVVNALYLFVLKESNIFDFGYATLDAFFTLAPWVFMFLIPALGMRTISDEFKSGTFEILKTLPLTRWQIAAGKYFALLFIIIIALLPTLLYVVTVKSLSGTGQIDSGGIAGSYIGLFLLAGVFASISLWCSSLTANAVIAFLLSAFFCILLYFGFGALSKIAAFTGGADYYIDMLGIDFHYRSLSRGVIDTRDVVYFLSLISLFLVATAQNLRKR